MAESPLARLLRLKKEKEQANGTASLEAVQRQSSETGGGEGNSGAGVSSSSRNESLPKETDEQTSGLDVSVPDVVPSEPSPEPVPVPEVKEEAQAKPMSAMDRLRALKSGGGSNGSTTSNSPASSSPADPVEPTPDKEVIPASPPKPRKTHPIAMEMAELEQALDAQVPGFVSILSQIHKKLRADPDVVTLLDDEEIAVIVAGLEKHTNVTIVAPSAIKAAKSKARKEPVSAMDL